MKKVCLALGVVAMLIWAWPTQEAGQDKVQTVFWHAMNASNLEMISQLVEEFNASQNAIEVVEESQGDYNSLGQKIMAAGVSGDLPTLSQMTAASQPAFIEAGLLQVLDSLLTEDNGFSEPLKASIYPGFWTEVQY